MALDEDMKREILSLVAHFHVRPKPYDFLSQVEHKRRDLADPCSEYVRGPGAVKLRYRQKASSS